MPENGIDRLSSPALFTVHTYGRKISGGTAVLIAVLMVWGCSPTIQDLEACRSKLSVTLFSLMESAETDTVRFDIVAAVRDTSGLRTQFPALSTPNGAVALGHLTKRQIISLCSHPNVETIDRSRTLFPK